MDSISGPCPAEIILSSALFVKIRSDREFKPGRSDQRYPQVGMINIVGHYLLVSSHFCFYCGRSFRASPYAHVQSRPLALSASG